MRKSSIICAGIDTGKRKLDVAIDGQSDELQVDNSPEGHEVVSAWLRQHRTQRVGIEASGGYEQAVVSRLRRDGFVVVVWQPSQVRAYAGFRLQRAKNDKIDARLIATCTAMVRKIHAPPDPRLAAFAAHLTMIDQIGDHIVHLKTCRESCRDAGIRSFWTTEIRRFKGLERDERKKLVAALRQHPDLTERLELIASVDGIGLPTALAILVRMPEIGQITREQAAALAGLAPYDNDSGGRVGIRQTAGGRERLRTALYAAALPAAMRWNAQLVALYNRMTAAGKPHKVALVACARKLLIFANTIVARRTPWVPKTGH